jgi:cytochrome P450
MTSVNLLAPDFSSTLYSLFAELRRNPIRQLEPGGMWGISRYDDALAALRDPRMSSAGLGRMAEPPYLGPNPFSRAIVTMDPPRHTRMRALVSHAFGPAGMARLENLVRRLCQELAEDVVRRREVEFIDSFAVPLPREVIGSLLGLDSEAFPKFKRWSIAVAMLMVAQTPELQQEVRSGLAEMEGYLREVIASRRRSPREDMVTELCRAEVEGSVLTDEEILSFLVLLLPAGLETTTYLLGNMMMLLSRHPHELERARADREHGSRIIEEVLRYESPVQTLFRLTTAEVELGGTRIPAGAMVAILVGSANRDETRFPDADRFLPDRPKETHLAFGHGTHFCLGAQLARMEARFALEALLPRLRAIRMPDPEVRWLHGFTTRGAESLPLELVPA